ncbi:MAG: CBS domain-containing protein [Pseudonocardiales bacterium]|nr:CBS domain-containing protein [Pseudonocardiales bacterium]
MSNPVISLRPNTPVPTVAALLVSHGFTAAPVMDATGRILGIATEADLIRSRVAPEGSVIEEAAGSTVAAVMMPAPITMGPDDDLADLVAVMLKKGIRSIPIVDDGRLVGIVSRRDVLRLVARRELILEDARHGR